jgi:hypothetical protein
MSKRVKVKPILSLYFHNVSYNNIASLLGVSKGSISRIVTAAKGKIQDADQLYPLSEEQIKAMLFPPTIRDEIYFKPNCEAMFSNITSNGLIIRNLYYQYIEEAINEKMTPYSISNFYRILQKYKSNVKAQTIYSKKHRRKINLNILKNIEVDKMIPKIIELFQEEIERRINNLYIELSSKFKFNIEKMDFLIKKNEDRQNKLNELIKLNELVEQKLNRLNYKLHVILADKKKYEEEVKILKKNYAHLEVSLNELRNFKK